MRTRKRPIYTKETDAAILRVQRGIGRIVADKGTTVREKVEIIGKFSAFGLRMLFPHDIAMTPVATEPEPEQKEGA